MHVRARARTHARTHARTQCVRATSLSCLPSAKSEASLRTSASSCTCFGFCSTHTRTHAHKHTRTHARTHVRTHAHTHTHTHTHTAGPLSSFALHILTRLAFRQQMSATRCRCSHPLESVPLPALATLPIATWSMSAEGARGRHGGEGPKPGWARSMRYLVCSRLACRRWRNRRFRRVRTLLRTRPASHLRRVLYPNFQSSFFAPRART